MQHIAVDNKTAGGRTLLLAVLVSASGLVLEGLGLIIGRSTTQIADFLRRSSELWAVIMAFVTYHLTTKDGFTDSAKKEKLERTSRLFIGVVMCFSGTVMLVLSFITCNTNKGNVIPGLGVAILATSANIAFWWKYSRLNKATPNQILEIQARLYRAKSLVDGCVTLALITIVIAPRSIFSYYFDLIGSIIVAAYLFFCGSKTIKERTTR